VAILPAEHTAADRASMNVRIKALVERESARYATVTVRRVEPSSLKPKPKAAPSVKQPDRATAERHAARARRAAEHERRSAERRAPAAEGRAAEEPDWTPSELEDARSLLEAKDADDARWRFGDRLLERVPAGKHGAKTGAKARLTALAQAIGTTYGGLHQLRHTALA
jgi:hypothetical protein